MIDLNSVIFDEKFAREEILKILTQEEIFTFYIGDTFLTQRVFNSPLREDNLPSFSIFYHRTYKDLLIFNDLATKEKGDCFILVSKLFNDIPMKQVYMKIAYDFNLSSINISKHKLKQEVSKLPKLEKKDKVDLGIKSREWLIKDKVFWQQFGISKTTLEKFKVKPIDFIFYNNNPIKASNLAYAYEEFKDNITSYKIYQPENIDFKWINSANFSTHQGYNQLPPTGDLLIITKSLKDVMSLLDVTGIAAIGLQSEGVNIKPSVLQEYKTRFKKVICLFDNDKAGIEFSKKISIECNIDYFFIPKINRVKDFSDLVKEIQKENALFVFNHALKSMNKN